MASEFAKSFYNSRSWRRTAKLYASSVGNLCERCIENGKYVKSDIVHHKKHINSNNINDTSITLDWNNLEALCKSCHNEEHFAKSRKVREGISFDNEGRLIIVNKK